MEQGKRADVRLFTCIQDVRLLTCGAINLSETGTVMVALRVFT